ncbi:MAG: glutamate-cysteine ligase family protein [Bradymonadia bacterium]
MGEQNIQALGEQQRKSFTRALLNEVRALEEMLERDMFEKGVRRIGAEQEMFLVDQGLHAAPASMSILDRAKDERLTTELGQFNLEANLTPLDFGGDCLRSMEQELNQVLDYTREHASALGTDVILAGILPTLRRSDITLEMMTPKQRYFELNRVMSNQRGGDFHVMIKGIDELEMSHDSVMFEACNTSFQIHFQVGQDEFASLYNIAQAVTAPVLAAAVNSPILLGKRLWSETRIALFERSVDTRKSYQTDRGSQSRVHFGSKWVDSSVLELFKEDISRQRIVIAVEPDENDLEVVRGGGVPKLKALRLHNGTVYRWNRPCYGISNGVPHLRIENRVLPSGPTVVDEVANAAFFFGLMSSYADEKTPISEQMSFDHAKDNFVSAARNGLKAQFTWVGNRTKTATDLIQGELLPRAREGLENAGITKGDIDRYLGVIEQRVQSERTGARWMVESLANMANTGTEDLRLRQLTSTMKTLQQEGRPVHEWSLAEIDQDKRDRNWRLSYQTVGQIMNTDLFTVRPDDIVDLAASVMEWSHVRHIPVENESGELVGLLGHRALLRLVASGKQTELVEVGTIMVTSPTTVGPDVLTTEAINIMREEKVSCLPVVTGTRLLGMITERDLIVVSAKLLEAFLEQEV